MPRGTGWLSLGNSRRLMPRRWRGCSLIGNDSGAIAAIAITPFRVYAVLAGAGIFRSDDRAVTWTLVHGDLGVPSGSGRDRSAIPTQDLIPDGAGAVVTGNVCLNLQFLVHPATSTGSMDRRPSTDYR
jgi:hypothetical protein